MQTRKEFKLRPLGDDYMIVPQFEGTVNFNRLISLNSTAAYLWQKVSERESFTVEDLSSLLVERYGIDAATADRDSSAIASKWLEAGIAIP